MSIPLEIQALIDRLNQELDETEQDANAGLNVVRLLLSRFQDNVRLIQFFTLFSNALLFIEISRRRIQAIAERISASDVTDEEIQEAGEDLGELVGRTLEAKFRGRQVLDVLEDLQ